MNMEIESVTSKDIMYPETIMYPGRFLKSLEVEENET